MIAIGASAGGLSGLRRFFRAAPSGAGAAYVVMVHMEPGRENRLIDVLSRWTSLSVVWIEESTQIQPEHVYVLSPGKHLRIEEGWIRVAPAPPGAPRMPVDHCFVSLAEGRGSQAAVVVLSGIGRDGALGCRAVREAGGIAAAQAPSEAAYPDMPRAAIQDGAADLVLPAHELPGEILRILTGRSGEEKGRASGQDDERYVEQIIARIEQQVGHDLGYYKRRTFLRRLDRRMSFAHCDTIQQYAQKIERDWEERQALFQDLLISVSRFCRDPRAFRVLEDRIVPKLFEEKGRDDKVRVWVAGCATGEEAYSLAMILHEHAAGLPNPPRIQVFATDLDAEALRLARIGHYAPAAVEELPEERLRRFFTRDASGFRIVEALRDSVLFAEHGVLTDPPFSRLDLVSCRNLLIYLEPWAQEEAVERFHYALEPNGFLFLGSSESVGPKYFEPIARTERIYRRVEGKGSLPRTRYRSGPRSFPLRSRRGPDYRRRESAPDVPLGLLHGRLLRSHAPPSLVVDSEYAVLHLSEHVGRFLRHPSGVLTRDLRDMAHEPFGRELRIAVYQAFRTAQTVHRTVQAELGGDQAKVRITVHPGIGDDARFALVVFEEQPAGERAGAHAERAEDPKDEALVRELRADLGHLREQLQAESEERELTIEELQSANEELQSVNEELETGREELQSVNEELITINHEHRATIDELAEANADLHNLMEATDLASVFLDAELRVRRATASAAEIFNLLPSDEGRPFGYVTHKLAYSGEVAADAREVLVSGSSIETEARHADGRWFILRILPYRSGEDHPEGVVLTCFDITDRKRMEQVVRDAKTAAEADRARLLALMEHLPAGIVIVDATTREVLSVNQRARQILWAGDDAASRQAADPSTPMPELPEFSRWPVEEALETGTAVLDREVSLQLEGEEHRDLLMSAALIGGADGLVKECVLTLVDIEEVLRQARKMEADAEEAKGSFVATISHEFRTPLNGIMGYTQLLAEGVPDPLTEAQALSVQRIQACVRHLTFMVEQILVLSVLDDRGPLSEPKRHDPREAVREAVLVVTPEAHEKALDLRLELPDRVDDIVTDPDKLLQILVNLVQNAVKYTERGEVVASVSRNGDDFVFEVRDTGIGIDAELHERIFERFWQAREGRHPTGVRGTGIGLFVVRKLAGHLGGVVEVESRVGIGSTFRVRLPAEAGPPLGSADWKLAAMADRVSFPGTSPAGKGDLK